MNTAVLLLVFNRPEEVRNTFSAIRAARPPRLYVAADGPRPGRYGEETLCRQAREIATAVDWPCEVKTLFRKRNLGCAVGVSSAITWFFQHEAEGIVLEDDLTPHPDFFSFCEAMLERYRHIEQIMHINGNNFQFGKQRGAASYYFSSFAHSWGWASWADAWKKYDAEMSHLTTFFANDLPNRFTDNVTIEHFKNEFSETAKGNISSWAYRWLLSVWRNNGICIAPNVNLVRVGGFGTNATHHTHANSFMEHMRTDAINDITHPDSIEINKEADILTSHIVYSFFFKTYQILVDEAFSRLNGDDFGTIEDITTILRKTYGEDKYLAMIDIIYCIKSNKYSEAEYLLEIFRSTYNDIEGKKLLLNLLKFNSTKKSGHHHTIRIELGSGGIARQGWIGVDLAGADINMDLTKDPLPFPDNSVDYIYSSHVFEHFSYPEPMLSILKECRRCLKDGGIFSICVPDAAIFIDAYMKGEYPEHPTSTGLYQPAVHFNSRIDIINYIAYMNGHHKHMFDIEGLLSILSKSGFKNVGQRTFDPVLDIAARHWQSIYAVATK